MAAGFREGFVEADGFRIRYMEAGEGPAFARAGTSAIGALRPMLPAAAKRRLLHHCGRCTESAAGSQGW
jgi:hypothetical protein